MNILIQCLPWCSVLKLLWVFGLFFYPWLNFTVAILSYLYLCNAPRNLSVLKTSQHGQALLKQPVIFQKSVWMGEIPVHNMTVNQDLFFAIHWSNFRFIPWELGVYFGSSGGIRFSRAVWTWTWMPNLCPCKSSWPLGMSFPCHSLKGRYTALRLGTLVMLVVPARTFLLVPLWGREMKSNISIMSGDSSSFMSGFWMFWINFNLDSWQTS